jgi:hypothetical protein
MNRYFRHIRHKIYTLKANHDSYIRVIMLALVMVGMVMPLPHTALAQAPSTLLTEDDFEMAVAPGFGDRSNSFPWSMQWWKGYLYVGTNRDHRCVEAASLNALLPPLAPYPPIDPDLECTATPEDLPLQAEIWRWSAATNVWQRVYQSPADVRLASTPEKLVARDIGYRGMTIFKEPDGTEALYVTAVGIQAVGMPLLEPTPTRILRTTDGVNFAPIPQAPGTFFGDATFGSYRNPVSYRGKLYVVGSPLQGSGALLESSDPARGNDTFRRVNPDGMTVSAVIVFNNFLYLGLRDTANGYSVVRTNALGPLPYEFTTIVEPGGNLRQGKNSEILGVAIYRNMLYMGGNGIAVGALGLADPAELIRIHPDDTWDLVVGTPRLTPHGWKEPISGLPAGFTYRYNAHMWRLVVHNDQLFVGTFDSTTIFKDDPEVSAELEPYMGFDLFVSTDGTKFTPITTDGFGDRFNYGVRTMVSTPYGLFVGATNPYYGLQIWRAPEYTAYLPVVTQDQVVIGSAGMAGNQ